MNKDRSDSVGILAAGGIVRGRCENEGKIAVVRRRRYGGEISLPKGKGKGKEDMTATALREVREETGYNVEIAGYAGTTRYRVGGQQKVVCYFIMWASGSAPLGPIDSGEIEAVEWMTPEDAVSALTHQEDRSLVAAVFGLPRG